MLSNPSHSRSKTERLEEALRKFDDTIQVLEQSLKVMINQKQLQNVTHEQLNSIMMKQEQKFYEIKMMLENNTQSPLKGGKNKQTKTTMPNQDQSDIT